MIKRNVIGITYYLVKLDTWTVMPDFQLILAPKNKNKELQVDY